LTKRIFDLINKINKYQSFDNINNKLKKKLYDSKKKLIVLYKKKVSQLKIFNIITLKFVIADHLKLMEEGRQEN
jgi:hypothetical protein